MRTILALRVQALGRLEGLQAVQGPPWARVQVVVLAQVCKLIWPPWGQDSICFSPICQATARCRKALTDKALAGASSRTRISPSLNPLVCSLACSALLLIILLITPVIFGFSFVYILLLVIDVWLWSFYVLDTFCYWVWQVGYHPVQTIYECIWPRLGYSSCQSACFGDSATKVCCYFNCMLIVDRSSYVQHSKLSDLKKSVFSLMKSLLIVVVKHIQCMYAFCLDMC